MFVVEIEYTSNLLQGEMCQSLIDNMTRLIVKEMALAFNIPISYFMYIAVEVHRYFCEQMLHFFATFSYLNGIWHHLMLYGTSGC